MGQKLNINLWKMVILLSCMGLLIGACASQNKQVPTLAVLPSLESSLAEEVSPATEIPKTNVSPNSADHKSSATEVPETGASPIQTDQDITQPTPEEVSNGKIPATQEPPTAILISETIAQPVPQQVVIQFDASTNQQEREAYVKSVGGVIVSSIDSLDTVVVRVAEVTALEALPQSNVVVSNEPDYYASALLDMPTSDPYYDQQWALPVIGAPEAWQELPEDAPKVTVAVVDSGVCLNHEDLVGRILDNGYDFVDNDTTAQDELGHGCGVAGIIAANIDNTIGIAGVAPNAQILPVRVLDATGIGTYSNVAAGIVYAVDNGAEIINLSLGGVLPSSVLEDAVNYAVDHDVALVAAAGNTGGDVLYPAKYEPVIAVGSLDQDMQPSSFSANGPEVDIWAPGSNIATLSIDNELTMVMGSSFASPYHAGLLALRIESSPSFLLENSSGEYDSVLATPLPTENSINYGSQGTIPDYISVNSDTIPNVLLVDVGDIIPVANSWVESKLTIENPLGYLWLPLDIVENGSGLISSDSTAALLFKEIGYIPPGTELTYDLNFYDTSEWVRIESDLFSDEIAAINTFIFLLDQIPGVASKSQSLLVQAIGENINELTFFMEAYFAWSDVHDIWADPFSWETLSKYASITSGITRALATERGKQLVRKVLGKMSLSVTDGVIESLGNTLTLARFTADGIAYLRTVFYHGLSSGNFINTYHLVPETSISNLPPQKPNLKTPLGPDINLQPTFTWGPVARYDYFRLQVDTSFDFNNPIIDITTTERSYEVSSPLVADTLYYWRVMAINDAGSSDNHIAAFLTGSTVYESPPIEDTENPTGVWMAPANNSSVSSDVVLLQVSAQDNENGIGIKEVRFSAKWNNDWYGIGVDTISPYGISWNWCDFGVPNGDVELGMEVWDYLGNKWIYSEHYPNIHITKSYNCEPPSNANVILYEIENYSIAGLFDSFVDPGQYNVSTAMNDKTSSVELPDGWSVKLYANGDQGDPNICINSDVPDLDALSFDDVVSSLEIFDEPDCPNLAEAVTFYENANYTGAEQRQIGTGWSNLDASLDEKLSSLKMPSGWSVELFRDRDRGSNSICVNNNVSDLNSLSFDDTASSYEIFELQNCQAPATGEWYVEYFENYNFNDRKCAFTFPENMFSLSWTDARPCQAITIGEEWSARYTGSFTLQGGTYVFHANHDDAVRWIVDGQTVLANWTNANDTWSDEIELTTGIHEMEIQFRQDFGGAHLNIDWYGPSGKAWPPPIPTPEPTPELLPPPSDIPATSYGDGSDGDLVVASGQTIYTDSVRTTLTVDANVGISVISVADTTGFTVGDEILILGAQGNTAGRYLFHHIAAISSNQITLTAPLTLDFYATGIARTQVIRVPNYANLTVQNGGVLTAHAWNGSTGGVVVFRVNGVLSVGDTGQINVSGLGFRGAERNNTSGNGRAGEGEFGSGSADTPANGMGGGGGCSLGGGNGAGGGGGGYLASGETGNPGNGNGCEQGGIGGNSQGTSNLTLLLFGGGGGAGGGNYYEDPNSYGGAGGSGGGIVLVYTQDLALAGFVHSNGINGEQGYGFNNGGNGAGGAGGSIFLIYNAGPDPNSHMTVVGGNGANYGGSTQDAGDGSDGRVRLLTNQPPAQLPLVDYGTGADGDLTVSSGMTVYSDNVRTYLTSSANFGQSQISVADTSGFSIGDEILIIQIQGLGAGQYEFKRISSLTSNSLSFQNSLQYSYTRSQTGRAQILRVPNYENVTIQPYGYVSSHSWNGETGGIVVFRVADNLVIETDGSAEGVGWISSYFKGFRGASQNNTSSTGVQGESTNGLGSRTTAANGTAGGGGCSLGYGNGAGGGGGGHKTVGQEGNPGNNNGCDQGGMGGTTIGVSDLTLLFFGGGGGSGGANYYGDTRSYGAAGGAGGGIVLVNARNIQANGIISAHGQNGYIGYGFNHGANGGGGAGGSILIFYETGIINSDVWFFGGSGGLYGTGSSQDGGDGGSGRYRAIHSQSSPNVPIILDPISFTTDNSPTFVWSDVSASTYDLELIMVDTGNVLFQVNTTGNCDSTNCSFTYGNSIAEGTYQWRIRSRASDGSPSIYTDFSSFEFYATSITGTITDTDANIPLDNVRVHLLGENGQQTCTNSNGQYEFSDVEVNSPYYVYSGGVSCATNISQHIGEYWEQASVQSNAIPLILTTITPTYSHIDLNLYQTALLSGVIQDTEGNFVDNIEVIVSDGVSYQTTTCTDSNGAYQFSTTINNLPRTDLTITTGGHVLNNSCNNISNDNYEISSLEIDLASSRNAVVNIELREISDDFDKSHIITALPFVDTINTATATTSGDDPSYSQECSNYGHTVWYSFTPSSDMLVNIDTFGSDFDTVLSIWSGSRGNLQEQACNDDNESILQSQLDVVLYAGTTYYFMVGGYGSNSGNLDLNIDIATTGAISGYVTDNDGNPWVSIPVVALGGGSACTDPDGYYSIVDLPINGSYEVTAGDFDNWCGGPPFFIPETYPSLVNLTSAGQVASNINFALDQVAPNDDFSNATVIDVLPYADSIRTDGLTEAADDPTPLSGNCSITGFNTLWYEYIPDVDGVVEFETVNSNYNTILSLWTGTIGDLTEIDCNDDIEASNGEWLLTSRLTAQLNAGTTYYVMVSDYDEFTGDGQLELVVDTYPTNVNLVSNGDFDLGKNGWNEWADIDANVENEVLEFLRQVSSTNAAFFQDVSHGALTGWGYELTVDLGNSSNVAKQVTISFRNSNDIHWNTATSCEFNLPPSAPLRSYTVRGFANSNWSNIRVELNPNPADGIAAILVDNVSFTHDPNMSSSVTRCQGPDAPIAENLVINSTFDLEGQNWKLGGDIDYQWIDGVLRFHRKTPVVDNSAWVSQPVDYTAPTNSNYEISVDLMNDSGSVKTATVILRHVIYSDEDQIYCTFDVPADDIWRTYKVQGTASSGWPLMIFEVQPWPADNLPSLVMDNVSVLRRTDLNLSETNCISPDTLDPPVIISPICDFATENDLPTFKWQAVAGATMYDIRLDTLNPPEATFSVTSTQFKPASPLFPMTYYWRVRTGDGAGQLSEWSQVCSLDITSPADAAPLQNYFSTDTPTLSWNRVTGATEYDVEVATDAKFTQPLSFSTTVGGDTLYVETTSLDNGTYYWRVHAKDDTNVGSWSVVQSFIVNVP